LGRQKLGYNSIIVVYGSQKVSFILFCWSPTYNIENHWPIGFWQGSDSGQVWFNWVFVLLTKFRISLQSFKLTGRTIFRTPRLISEVDECFLCSCQSISLLVLGFSQNYEILSAWPFISLLLYVVHLGQSIYHQLFIRQNINFGLSNIWSCVAVCFQRW
jgi:hypothetical protein